ncbi:MAG: hypothetical protein ABIR83_13990 [Nakamurella sp.]
MDFSTDLTAHLATLTEALNGSGDDLGTILGVLFDDLVVGISSFVGMSITVSAGQEPVTVTAMRSHAADASMLLPLGAVAGGGHIVLYAQNRGAFVDLAADARSLSDHSGEIIVDGHLPPPTAFAAHTSMDRLADRSSIDQALGFLIGQGYPPPQARAELTRRASAAGVTLAQIAHLILDPDHRPDTDSDAAAAEPDDRAG